MSPRCALAHGYGLDRAGQYFGDLDDCSGALHREGAQRALEHDLSQRIDLVWPKNLNCTCQKI